MAEYRVSKGAINNPRLTTEIKAILPSLDYLTTEGDDVLAYFPEELSAEDQTILSDAIASHESETLAELKARKIAEIEYAMESYIGSHYTIQRRLQLGTLLQLAQSQGKTNRVNYIFQAANWALSIFTYCDNKQIEIAAAATKEDVDAITYDIAANAPADPGVTRSGALAIAN